MKTSRFVFLSSWLMIGVAVHGADVSYYGIVKSAQYVQTNTAAPVLLGTNPYAFSAFVVASTNNVVTNATVSSSATPTQTLLPDTNGLSWRFSQAFASQTALDTAYPTGSGFSPVNYTMTMYTTNDGVRSGSLSFYLLILPLSYPATAQLANLPAAQDIDTTRDFTLGWNPLGGSSLTIVQLTILDAASNLVYASPAPFQTGALNGASTSTVIPAYSLPPGALLQGHLTIANPGNPNTNSYPGATGVAALAKDTQFSLATRPAPVPPFLDILASNPFQLLLVGDTNRLYQIEASGDLTNWTSIFSTNSAEGSFEFTDGQSGLPRRFYRAKVGQ